MSVSNVGDPGSIPGSERSPGEGNGNPSSILAWRIPWTQEPGRLQSMGSQRVRQNLATSLSLSLFRFKHTPQSVGPYRGRVQVWWPWNVVWFVFTSWKIKYAKSGRILWPRTGKVSVFIPIPKKGNAKECSN